jgi:FtsH-binding integral membrane protein
MDNYNQNSFNPNQWNSSGVSSTDVAVKTFMTNVFAWMFGALLITAATAFAFSHIPALTGLLFNTYQTANGVAMGLSGLGMAVMISPLIFVLVMSFGFNKLSVPALVGIFLLYAATTGASLSTIFFRYDLPVLAASFAITAGMFGTMAFMGFVTKADLSKFGAIMWMGFIGILIASIVNFFLHSAGLDYLISFVGVAVFTGLTAWDVQRLKQIGAGVTYGGGSAIKLSIMGALRLYLDFLNLFLFILRLMGGNRR